MEEFFLIIHFLFILYLTFGLPIGLYFNHRKFRLIHAALMASVSILMILEIPCPLTALEEWISSSSYTGSFLATWLNQIIYLTWMDTKSIFWLDIAFSLLVFSSFLWYPLKKKSTILY